MTATKPNALKTDPAVTCVLAQLLERPECSVAPVRAEQHQPVLQHLVSMLGEVEPITAPGDLLDSPCAAAESYENLNYQRTGLCCLVLDAPFDAELQAKEVLDRAMRRATDYFNSPHKEDPTHGKS